MKIEDTLVERGKRYGEFSEHARITQAIKFNMQDSPNWTTLSADKREALEMIAHKIGRILNGDPEYADSWHDIVGYAQLVENNLNAKILTSRQSYPFVEFIPGDLVSMDKMYKETTGLVLTKTYETASCRRVEIISTTHPELKPNDVIYCHPSSLTLITSGKQEKQTKFKINDLVYLKCLSGTMTGSIKDAGEDGSYAVKIISSYTNAPLKPNEIYYCMAQDLELISHEETKSSCI